MNETRLVARLQIANAQLHRDLRAELRELRTLLRQCQAALEVLLHQNQALATAPARIERQPLTRKDNATCTTR